MERTQEIILTDSRHQNNRFDSRGRRIANRMLHAIGRLRADRSIDRTYHNLNFAIKNKQLTTNILSFGRYPIDGCCGPSTCCAVCGLVVTHRNRRSSVVACRRAASDDVFQTRDAGTQLRAVVWRCLRASMFSRFDTIPLFVERGHPNEGAKCRWGRLKSATFDKNNWL